MTTEERAWWVAERPRVLAKKFGGMFLTAGGFSAIAGFTRPFFTDAGPVDLVSALRSAFVGVVVAVVIAAAVVLVDGGRKERDRLLRERRLRDAMRE